MAEKHMLYHYTTPAGLQGIIKTRSLWATSAYYLNDAHELRHGIELGRNRLEALLKTEEATSQSAGRIKWLLHDIRHAGTAATKPVFVCSFSEESDSLSQWRAYCHGGGFAVGFPLSLLEATVADQQFVLQKCIYKDHEQQQCISEVIERITAEWINGNSGRVEQDDRRFLIGPELFWELTRAASSLKNESFAEEREYRIVSKMEQKYDKDKRFFRAGRGMLIPYTEIVLPNDKEFWRQVHVIVGPTPHQTESARSVYDLFVREWGTSIAITNTQVPFRDW